MVGNGRLQFLGAEPLRRLERVIPLLLLVTGVTGLVYEVVLSRLLSQHLGSSGSSQGVTLAAFLGGLALGAALADRAMGGFLRRVRQPVLGYALLEGCIGLWVLAFPFLANTAFGTFETLLGVIAPQGQAVDMGSPLVVAAKLVVAAVLILPLTTAMGATLPVLAAGVERANPGHGVWLVSRYYYLNAAGAAFGALLAGFVLIEALGLELPLTLGAFVNLAVALVAWRLFRTPPGSPTFQEAPVTSAAPITATGPAGRWIAAAFLTGFVSLSCEVLWTRLTSLLLGASTYSFSFMLTVAIAGISAGSAVASRRIRKGSDPAHVLGVAQVLAGGAAWFLLARADRMAFELTALRSRLVAVPENYSVWLVLGGGWLALHLLPAALALGAAFPALLAAAQRDGARTDRAAARILVANTCGNLVGALGGGFVLMPLLGVEAALGLAGALSMGVALLVWPRPWTLKSLAGPAAVAAGAILWFAVVPLSDAGLVRGLFRVRGSRPAEVWAQRDDVDKIVRVFRHDGKDATIVVDKFPSGHLVFRTNGKSDGGTGDVATQVMLGHLGLLVRPDAREAFVVGLGTGQTAAALISHPDVRVHAVELSPAVVDVARIFANYNQNVLKNPRLRVTLADAREVLRALPAASLDLVVSEPSNPWVVGVADLYTKESFTRIRERLRASPDGRRGGVLVQWIHTYEMSDRTLRAIVCTLQSVFGHVAVFRMDPGDLALVASDRPLHFDSALAGAALQAPAVQAELAAHKRADIPRRVEHFLTAQLCGEATVAEQCKGFDAPLSEDFPLVEYTAPRDFFAGTKADRLVGMLDTRYDRQPDVWLAEHLRRRPLDAAARASLGAFLVAGKHPNELALAAAMTDAVDLPVAVSAALAGLPDSATVPLAMRKTWCRWIERQVPWIFRNLDTVLGRALLRSDLSAWRAACSAGPRGALGPSQER